MNANISSTLSRSDASASFENSATKPLSTSRGGNAATTVFMLAWREWVRFFRQRNRVIGAVGQPILFWLLFGTGMHSAFRASSGQDFMSYYMPGTMALIVLFTAIFATISIIEDRREGFLQAVLVAPVPRWTIALGKILGGAAIAWVQALFFLALAIGLGSVAWSLNLLPLVLLIAVAAIGMTALGVMFAWPMESTQGFHAIMNLVLMPMWLLSGAFFPVPLLSQDSPIGQTIMHWTMRLNPVTYIIGGMRHLLSPGIASQSADFWIPGIAVSWIVSLTFMLVTFAAAWWIVSRTPSRRRG